MLAVHLDESGSHPRSDVFVVAGLVASCTDWHQLSIEWKNALDAVGVESFHMKEFTACRGAFSAWDKKDPRRDALMRTLVGIIRRYVSHRTWTVVPLVEYRKGDPKEKMPYSFCAMGCASRIGAMLRETPESEPMPYVFDRDGRNSGKMFTAFDFVRNHDGGRSYGMQSLSTASSRETPPLQAADLHAWEVNKYFADQLKGIDRTRQSLLELLDIPQAGGGGYLLTVEKLKMIANPTYRRTLPSGAVHRADLPVDDLSRTSLLRIPRTVAC